MTRTPEGYLDMEYPNKKERKNVEAIHCREQGLEGHFDLSDFVNLKSFDCADNYITSIDVSKNTELHTVKINKNEIVANLNIFSHLTKLAKLDLGMPQPSSQQNNRFSGSLEALKDCKKLW